MIYDEETQMRYTEHSLGNSKYLLQIKAEHVVKGKKMDRGHRDHFVV